MNSQHTVGAKLREIWARLRADRALDTDSVSTHPLPRSKLPATSFLKRFKVWYVLFSKGVRAVRTDEKRGGEWRESEFVWWDGMGWEMDILTVIIQRTCRSNSDMLLCCNMQLCQTR